MPSSTSASKSPAIAHARILLAVVAILIAGIEIAANYLLQHESPTYARIAPQYDHALDARPAEAGEPPTVLMVGNSLLLHGIELDRLQEMTSSRMRVYPIFLEATGYYDWLYGLRRLFREGARPNVVVVGVGVNYFLESGVRQDYAPKLFFGARDTVAVASDLKLDHTATSNLLLAHWSTFWDTRSAIRTQVLKRCIPHLEDLFSLIHPRPAIPGGEEFEAITIPRLQKLQQLCADHGAKLILLLPPTLSSEEAIGEMTQAAQRVGVEVSVPINPSVLSSRFYEPDGMHLNAEGATLFTSALARDLPERLVNASSLGTTSRVRADVHVPLSAMTNQDEYPGSVTDSDF